MVYGYKKEVALIIDKIKNLAMVELPKIAQLSEKSVSCHENFKVVPIKGEDGKTYKKLISKGYSLELKIDLDDSIVEEQ